MIGLTAVYCASCGGRGWIGNLTYTCPYCHGTGVIGTWKGIGHMTPDIKLKKQVRRTVTINTTVHLDADTVEKILAQAAGAPERGWTVTFDGYGGGYGGDVTVSWSTTETEEPDE